MQLLAPSSMSYYPRTIRICNHLPGSAVNSKGITSFKEAAQIPFIRMIQPLVGSAIYKHGFYLHCPHAISALHGTHCSYSSHLLASVTRLIPSPQLLASSHYSFLSELPKRLLNQEPSVLIRHLVHLDRLLGDSVDVSLFPPPVTRARPIFSS